MMENYENDEKSNEKDGEMMKVRKAMKMTDKYWIVCSLASRQGASWTPLPPAGPIEHSHPRTMASLLARDLRHPHYDTASPKQKP